MNQNQIQIICELLKAGKQYKCGHYHYGYNHLSYNNEKKLFEVKREDLSSNIFEPTLSFEYYSDNDFYAHLNQYYKFEDMMSYFNLNYQDVPFQKFDNKIIEGDADKN